MSDRSLTLDAIVNAVASLTELTRTDITWDRRNAHAVEARDTIFWLARRLTPLSSKVIGRLIGQRDHTTVLAGAARAEQRRQADADYRLTLHALEGVLRAVERSGTLRIAAVADPLAAARRIVADPVREAVRVSVTDIVAMAQLVVELMGESDETTPDFSATRETEDAA